MQNRFGKQENGNKGMLLGSHGVKENRGSTSKSLWREKKKCPLISNDSYSGSLEENKGVQSRKNKHREEEYSATMCIDSCDIEREGQRLRNTKGGEGDSIKLNSIVLGQAVSQDKVIKGDTKKDLDQEKPKTMNAEADLG
ncbi:hypothetical protein QYF36_005161 [Acer negundo]|nr:hypothetical protein QYF36_005161 [Acer negundo]